MRTIIITAALLATVSAFAAEPQLTDTIKVIDNASQIIVTRTGNTTKIEALVPNKEEALLDHYVYSSSVSENESTAAEPISENIFAGFPFLNDRVNRRHKNSESESERRSRRRGEVTALRNVYWGWNFAYDGKAGISNCFEVGVAEVIDVRWIPWQHGPELRVGLGFGMKRYTSGDNMMFAREGDRLTLVPAGTEVTGLKSRWDTWTIHVPFMLSQNISHNFGIAVGALVNFNTYSTARTSREINGTRYSEKFKRLQQRLLTSELIAIIGFREAIGFYVKWNPVPLMKECYGPEFRSWSMGVSLDF